MLSFSIFRGIRKPLFLDFFKSNEFRSFTISCCRSLFTRKMSATRQMFFRVEDDGERYRLSFHYGDDESGTGKELHFNRNLSEPVHVLFSRISLKLSQSIGKQKKNKMKKLETPAAAVSVQLLRNGIVVVDDTITCKDLLETNNVDDVVMKIGDQDFTIVKNAPWIHNIALPNCIMAGFVVYPRKLEGLFIDVDESEFSWYRRKDGFADELLGTGYFYMPSSADIGYKLKLLCVPMHEGMKGVPVETCSTCEVEAGPGHCPFEDRHAFTNTNMTGASFRVVSYNILADLYASSTTGKEELFSFCPPYCLAIDYRQQLLLKELIGYNADIICLQEVDCRIFEKDLKRCLGRKNLVGVLAKKGGQVNEGVACFYNQSRFQLVSNFSRTLGEDSFNEESLKSIWNVVKMNDYLWTSLKERTTVVQVLVFDYVDQPKRKLVVANTHLYFHPNADHIRLLQAGMCLQYIEDIVRNFKKQEPDTVFSVVFCGDFNSTPECGVYQLLTTSEIPANYHEWLCGNETVAGLSLRTCFNFKSACGTPDFTNYSSEFKGCLDYIYYETDFLVVEQVVPFPSEEEVSKYTAIPSIVFPSDHIALVADLAWK